MAEIKIAGIMRAGAYSPNHIGNDATIFNMVADQLRKRGCVVNVYSEEQFIANGVEEPVVLNMCRERRSLELLQAAEDSGRLVINSGYGIENCTRERMTRILLGSNIPYPESLIVSTDEAVRDTLRRMHIDRCWIKRADSHSMHQEDVTYVRNTEEAQEILQEYFLRGIKRAVISRHLQGNLLKFYGMVDTPFFHWFFPMGADHSKYSQDRQAADEMHPTVDEAYLKALCTKAADALDVKIYGGECIVDSEGRIVMIDFNDWPSFAPCRQEAAPLIARKVLELAKQHVKTN